MTNLSKRFLRGKPMKLTTSATLAQMRDSLKLIRPELTAARPGWGSIADSADILGALMAQPAPSDPEILPGVPTRHPDVLVARLYWFQQLRTRIRNGVPAPPQYSLNATDVIISHEAGDEYLLFVSALADKEHDQVIPAIKRAVQSVDANVLVTSSTSSLDLEEADLFMWLLRQKFANDRISASVDIDDVDFVRASDPLSFGTSLDRGIQIGRLELTTLLANKTSRFGPAKFSITDNATGLACELTLWVNGSFDVTVAGINYLGAPVLSTEAKRLSAVMDLLYQILPGIKNMYFADKAWRHGNARPQFQAQMKALATSGVAAL